VAVGFVSKNCLAQLCLQVSCRRGAITIVFGVDRGNETGLVTSGSRSMAARPESGPLITRVAMFGVNGSALWSCRAGGTFP
jgi:hypothetical protein